MPDIVSQGRDRGPSPWPRWIVAAVVLALVAAGLAEHLGHRTTPAARPAASAGPRSNSGQVSVQARAVGPDGITGPVSGWPHDLVLITTAQQPAWFWPATGRFQSIQGLPSWRPGYLFTRTPQGWVVQATPASPATPATTTTQGTTTSQVGTSGPVLAGCAGCAEPVYYVADGARTAHKLGVASSVAPGATPGTLWLTGSPPGATTGSDQQIAQQMTVTGTKVGAPVRLPFGFSIVQGTPRGLLLAPTAPQPGVTLYELWTHDTNRVFSGVLAVSAHAIAWSPPCESDCRVHVLSLDSGQETSIALPRASTAANAAFSPDGRYLALQLSYANNGDDGALAMRLAVATLPGGHLTDVPHASASSDALISFGWPAAGDTLVAELSFSAKVQLAAWHPGDARLAVATLTPHHAPPPLALAPFAP